MNSHIADRAGFLAALAKDDPERVEAEEHARGCAPCREAFAEGLGLVALLDESQPLSPPSPDLLARAASAIEQQSAGEASVNRRVVWGAVTGVLVAWAFQLTVGSGFSPDLEHAAASLMVLGVALAGVTLLRNQPKLAIALVAATSLAMVSVVGHGVGSGAGRRHSLFLPRAVGRGPHLDRRGHRGPPGRGAARALEADGHRRLRRAGGARRPAPGLRSAARARSPASVPFWCGIAGDRRCAGDQGGDRSSRDVARDALKSAPSYGRAASK